MPIALFGCRLKSTDAQGTGNSYTSSSYVMLGKSYALLYNFSINALLPYSGKSIARCLDSNSRHVHICSLILQTMPRHKAYSKNDLEIQKLRATCEPIVVEMERLKRELQLEDIAQLEQAPFKPTAAPGAVMLSAGVVPGLQWDDTAPSAPSDIDLSPLERLGQADWAASLADAQQATAPTAPVPPQAPTVRIPDLPDLTPSIALPAASLATLSKHALVPLMPVQDGVAPSAPPPRAQQAERPLDISYNSLLASLSEPRPPAASFPHPSPYDGQVQLGPQELGVQTVPYPTVPPPPGASCCDAAVMPPVVPVPPPPDAMPVSTLQEVKRRKQLRDVHVSAALMNEFLRYAIANTHRGIETCGILAGVLSPDDARFTVTTLIVPKQEGTTDTVQALAEEEIFEAQDSRGLYPLGWIHTHPTQTCFLSSIDVHTQCGYQTMLDEAVAIVMAPRDARNKVGIFRLSTPGGLSLVQKCGLRGFHAHPPTETGQEVYELSNHVYLNPRVNFEVVDLR